MRFWTKSLGAFAVMFGLASLQAGGAQAAGERLVGANSPTDLMEALRGFGSVELDKDSGGDPRIVGRIDSIRYVVLFYDCDKSHESCVNVQFRANWSTKPKNRPTLKKINDWNRKKIFGKAYLDSDGDPTVEMPIIMDGKIPLANFEKNAEMWRDVIKEFQSDVVGW